MSGLRRSLSLVTAVLSRALEVTLMVAVFVLVLDVLWGVATRYLLGRPSPWTEEVAQYLLMWVALLGAAVAFRRRAHLGLDYLVSKMDPSAQKVNAVVVNLIVIVFAALVMVAGGWVLVRETLGVDQRTAALNMPMGYVYMVMPISGMFFILFALQQIVGDSPRVERHDEPPAT